MIVWDLDGTLADCEHRRHFIDPSKNKDYEYSNFGKDPITREVCCDHSPRWHQKDNWNIKFNPDWKSFYEACDQDSPIEPTIEIITSYGGYDTHRKYDEIMIWSGRCESVRDKTEKWLSKHGIHYHSLKMRPIGDYTPDDELKEKWLDEVLAEGKTIDFVFDDRPKVIRMWRRRGIFVFNCCQHDEEF